MGRTTNDLIAELQAVAADGAMTALVVGFEENTEFVYWKGDGAAALEELNAMMRRGGEPMGMLSTDLVPEGLQVRIRRLAEHEHEEWVVAYLQSLTDAFLQVAREYQSESSKKQREPLR